MLVSFWNQNITYRYGVSRNIGMDTRSMSMAQKLKDFLGENYWLSHGTGFGVSVPDRVEKEDLHQGTSA